MACSSQAGRGIPKESAQCSHHPHSSSLQQAGLAQGGHDPTTRGPEAEAARGSEAPPRAGARLWGPEGSCHLPFRGPLNMNTAPGLVRIPGDEVRWRLRRVPRAPCSCQGRRAAPNPGRPGSQGSPPTGHPKMEGPPCTEAVGVPGRTGRQPFKGSMWAPETAPPQLPVSPRFSGQGQSEGPPTHPNPGLLVEVLAIPSGSLRCCCLSLAVPAAPVA